MRKTILLLAFALALTPICRGEELAASGAKKPAKTPKVTADSVKAEAKKLPDTFTQAADTMYKPGSDMIPDKNVKVRAPGAPGIEPDAGDAPADSKAKSSDPKDDAAAKKDIVKTSYLSPDKGIGPIKELKVGPIDTTLVSKGKALFNGQCVICHQLDKKKIGPPLRTVADDRPPEFIMNMLLNTDEMQKKDPEVKKLIAQYGGVLMSVTDIKQDQARQLLEYLRWEAKQPPSNK